MAGSSVETVNGVMATITVLKLIGHAFARMASRPHFEKWQRRLSGGDLQRPIQGKPYARNGSRQFPRFVFAVGGARRGPRNVLRGCTIVDWDREVGRG
jgi:hypothetical protein